jgi:hypothetical protein
MISLIKVKIPPPRINIFPQNVNRYYDPTKGSYRAFGWVLCMLKFK